MDGNSPWLAVMAIAAVVQSLILVGLAIGAFRLYRLATTSFDRMERLTTTSLERIERQTLGPLVSHAQRAVDRFEGMVDRIEHADDSVRAAISSTTHRVSQAASIAVSKFWPVVGIGRGAVAAFAAFTSRRTGRPFRPASLRLSRERPDRPERLAREDENRFVYEGGIDHARS